MNVRQLLLQFPNSKFAPEVQQKLRNIQEVLAAHEYAAAAFYHHKGSFPAAANRFTGLVDQYPLFSQADEALWMMADSYSHMGDRFEDRAADAYTRIAKDYPLSDHADAAKERLETMKRPVPQADPVAYARMKYEMENRTSVKLPSRVFGVLKKNPDMSLAAKSGTPTMTAPKPTVPASVPQPSGAASGVGSDVTATTVTDSKELDSRPDARQNPPAPVPAPGTPAAAPAAPAPASPQEAAKTTEGATAQQPFATNHPVKPTKKKKAVKKAEEPAAKPQTQDTSAPASTPPATGTPTPQK